jgi:purine-binding chemotaxis protein CheW
MDRAERIRNMREGNRGTDDEPTEADGSGETADEPTDETSTPDASVSENADTAGDSSSPGAGSDPEPADPEDPNAVAQRAAAAAEDVAGGGLDTAAAGGVEAATGDGAGANAASTGTMAGGPSGVELPDQELLEQAMAQSTTATTEGAARAAAVEGESSQTEELARVLEFSLGGEYYCLDIEYVEEIVKREAVTRVPNTEDFVDGVVDLRGQITTILEPKAMMDIDGEGEQNLIVVFDPDRFEDQGAIGWVVDEVRQVVPVTESEVNDPPVDADYVNGVVDREEYDQFVIWIEPDSALKQATADEDD